MGSSHVRVRRGLWAAAISVVLFGATACPPPTPTTPTGPSVSAAITMEDGASTFPTAVVLRATTSSFPAPTGISPDYSVTYTVRDVATGGVVYSEINSHGNADGIWAKYLQAGLFKATISGSTATIHVAFDVTMERDGVSAHSTASAMLSWSLPSSPITTSMAFTQPGYQVTQATPTACAPVGTEVTVALTGETSSAAAGFSDFTVNFGSNFAVVGPGATVVLTTTTECWSVVAVRASFIGGLTGATGITVSWSPPAT